MSADSRSVLLEFLAHAFYLVSSSSTEMFCGFSFVELMSKFATLMHLFTTVCQGLFVL